MNSKKGALELQKKTRESSRGLEEKDLGGSIANCATLINRTCIMVQAPRSEDASPEERESYSMSGKISAKWHA